MFVIAGFLGAAVIGVALVLALARGGGVTAARSRL
jgi:hypothetical protein